MRKTRLLKEVKFELKEGQYLVANYTLLGAGLGRIIVENKNGAVKVSAETGPSGSRFEFGEGKTNPNQCDFWLANAKPDVLLKDIIRTKFWGQFSFGELFRYQKDQKLSRKINREITKLVAEFEEKAAIHLNALLKK